MNPVTVCLGVSHHTAPVALRERLAYSPTQTQSALRRLLEESAPEGALDEAVLLHTCNRTEFYVSAEDGELAERVVAGFVVRLMDLDEADAADFMGHTFAFRGERAERHLMEVAAGLDSMVVGEYQVLGQVGEASRLAQAAGTSGPRLTQLFACAVKAGRRARAETEIGRGAASVPSAAVALARRNSDTLENGVVVVVGAGKVGLLTAKGLRDLGAKRIIVSNRSYDRAVDLARTWDGCAVTFEELPRALSEADIVIASTAAPHAVITRQMLEEAMDGRRERALTIVDIAVPRDVEPGARSVPGVRLYDMDDLQAVTQEAAADRSVAVPAVRAIVESELISLHKWERRLEVEPTVRALRQWGDRVLEDEVADALRRLSHLDEKSRDVVTAMANAIAGKLLHPPTAALRARTGRRDAAAYAATVRELYALNGFADAADVAAADMAAAASQMADTADVADAAASHMADMGDVADMADLAEAGIDNSPAGR